MTTTCGAPGKIFLFGEHAVVHGQSAIACAIDIRTHVTVKESDSIDISSDLGTTGLDYKIHPYISAILERFQIKNASIKVTSDIPIGAGLGSSAAVTVATLGAINKEFGFGYNKQEIANIGYDIEYEVQGMASPTDTFVSTFGGIFEIPSRNALDTLKCDIIIGNTNTCINQNKTGKLIRYVALQKEEYPEIINPIFKTINLLTEIAIPLIRQKDYVSIGKLMNINHGLLEALNVGTSELSGLVYASRNAGAFGAKITGAGGGGCMVALTNLPSRVASAIKKAGGDAIKTRITPIGLQIE